MFRIKEDGSYKARLVVRGYELRKLRRYIQSSNKCKCNKVFSIGANQDKHIVKFDVKTAFLNGELNHEIYMNIPESYNIKDKVCSNLGNYSKCKRERRNRADVRQ